MRLPIRRILGHPVSLVLVGVFSTLAVIFLPFLLFFAATDCEDSGLEYSNSGSPHYVARVVGHNCGATTTWRTEVVVSTRSSIFPYREEKKVVFEVMMEPHGIVLRWDSDKRLIIQHPTVDEARIRVAVPVWRDVTIAHHVATQ